MSNFVFLKHENQYDISIIDTLAFYANAVWEKIP